MKVVDVETPPHGLGSVIADVEAVSLYESDVTPEIASLLQSRRFVAVRRFDDGRARGVVVYRRR
jgi:hypothetical protein